MSRSVPIKRKIRHIAISRGCAQKTIAFSSHTTLIFCRRIDRGPAYSTTSLIVGDARFLPRLNVNQISSSATLRSPWNDSNIYETSRSTQHLCVPSKTSRSNRHSDGNISLPVPQIALDNIDDSGEQLLDPNLISETVRRSLLALHRESQDNIHTQRHRENTQSENDVNGSFASWKIKMKSKLRRTHHQEQHFQSHGNTLGIHRLRHTINDHDQRMLDYVTLQNAYRYSTPPVRRLWQMRTPAFEQSLKHYAKSSKQSTTESESTQGDGPMVTSSCTAVNPVEEEDVIRAASDKSGLASHRSDS